MPTRARDILSFFVLSALLAAPSLLPGCVGTSVGNPPGAEVKLAVVGTVSPPSAVKAIDVGGGVTIDEAWVSLRELGLREAGTCGNDAGDYDVAGPVAAELVTGSLYPEAPVWERSPDARYCGFRARVDALAAEIANTPDELWGHAVFIRGARVDGTPFVAEVDAAELVRIAAKAGPELDLGPGPLGLILAFDLRLWLDAPMLDSAEVTDGVIVINAESNKEIEKALRQRIPASSRLFHDVNRDGRLNEGDGEL